MQLSAFSPQGNCLAITASTSPPAGVQLSAFSAGGMAQPTQYVFYNSGSVDAFISYAADATTAQTNAVVPTGTGQKVVPVPAKMMVTFTLPAGSFLSGATSSSTATVYAVPGEGV